MMAIQRVQRRLTAIILGSLLLFPGVTIAADINPVRFVMPNGVTVLVIEEHSLPIVQIHALVKAGSAQDLPEKAGLANFVASLLDEGTTSRTAGQIADQIEFVGGSLHSRSSEDFTNVSARVLKKDMELGFELLADVLQHPVFAEAEVERVRAQLIGQIQSEKDDPGQLAAKAFHHVVFDGHPYRWPVNGTEETLPHITRQDLQSFHAREYLPNQTVIAVVGDLNGEQVRTLLTKHFGGWKRGATAARTARPVNPLEKPVIRLIEKDLTQATIMLGHASISRTNPDYYAFMVMNYILGAGGFSSRLMDSIRDNQGLAYSVASMLDANLMAGSFFVSLQTRNEAANQALNGVLNEVKGMRDGTVTDQELNDAKAYLIGSFPLRLETTAKLAEILTLVEFFGLGLDYFTQYPRWIERVTKEDVQRVSKQYLHPDRYALVLVGNLAKAKIRQ